MIIKNNKEIGITETRKQVLGIIEVGIKSVLPTELILPTVKYNAKLNTVTVTIKDYHLIKGRIFVVGGGKVSGLMAEIIEKIIGPENITAGVVNTVKGKYRTKKIEINEAEHPLPGKRGVRGTEKMLELKDKYKIDKRDLIICLISGGGSAMISAPVGEVNLKDQQAATELLIRSGATINDINTVRKHISRVKGGQLAKHFTPAQVVSLIISDVVNNDLNVIASGPTVPDPTTFNDAMMVLEKYKLNKIIPEPVLNYIRQGCNNQAVETPKQLINSDNYIIGKNALALEAMAYQAKLSGFKPLIVTHELTGEPEMQAKKIAEEIIYCRYEDYDMLLYGGETTPKVPDKAGKGGRNQHLAAAFLEVMQDLEGEWLVASVGTDGQDYDTGVAGALADNKSLEITRAENIIVKKYLDSFDSYGLFKKMGTSQIITGDTGTNVGDVMVIVIK